MAKDAPVPDDGRRAHTDHNPLDGINLNDINFEQISNILREQPSRRVAILDANNYKVLRAAIRHNDIELFQRLVQYATREQIRKMINANDFEAFRSTLSEGREQMHRYLMNLVSSEQRLELVEIYFRAGEPLHPRFNRHLEQEQMPGISASESHRQTAGTESETLRRIAINRESAMDAVTAEEKMALGELSKRYMPQIEKQGGVDNVIRSLMRKLEERFNNANPQILGINQRSIPLPFEWEAFQRLDPQTKQVALKAYYENVDHTAYRFLMRPNPWLDPNALFTKQVGHGFVANFEPYQDLIAIMYLAAIDPDISVTDGFTVDKRLQHFIKELSLIGRAHNWDNSRNIEGKQSEEYDDLKEDKPSCGSGIKKRLLQSVLGNPLCQVLTDEILKQEITEFVRQRVMMKVTPKNCKALLAAWKAICEADTDTDKDIIKTLNISPNIQQSFIKSLLNKYGSQFVPFQKFVVSCFEIKPPYQSHAELFSTRIGLETILQSKVKQYQEQRALSDQSGFFTESREEHASSDGKKWAKKSK